MRHTIREVRGACGICPSGGGDVEKWVPATSDVTPVMASLAETNVPHSGLSSLGAEVGRGDGRGEKMGETVTQNLRPMLTELTN